MNKAKRAVIAFVVVMIGLAPTIVLAIREVSRGHGAAAYTNVYGLAIHWTSLLILLGVLVVALLGALIARLLYFWGIRRDVRALDRALDARDDTHETG